MRIILRSFSAVRAALLPFVCSMPLVSLSATTAGNSSDFKSDYYAAGLAKSAPAFNYLAVDSLGKADLGFSPILTAKLPEGHLQLERKGKRFCYTTTLPDKRSATVWEIEFSSKRMVLRSRYVAGVSAQPFTLLVDQKKNHATLLGLIAPNEHAVSMPCVLHFPDHGTFRVSGNVRGAKLNYEARRWKDPDFVQVEFPAAAQDHAVTEYVLEVTSISPKVKGIEKNARFDAFRRNFLNIFQINPRLHSLANHASSDVCGLCFYEYAEMALHTPALAKGVTCLDLIRVSLDRCLDGAITYGQAGYKATAEFPEAAPWGPPCDSLDTYPSLLIAAGDYILGSKDYAWGAKRYAQLTAWTRDMLAKDKNGNGLIEYQFSGNSGSWSGERSMRPANWWDTIGFGYEDAYANALAYRALTLMAQVAGKLNHSADRDLFTERARRLHDNYVPTFYNPETGILAGWKSADGKLHDYWFTFVNGLAISQGLVEEKQANAIMDQLLRKMQEVGYTNLSLGLPGNLVPVRREDYTERDPRCGGGTKPDGSDGFQIYENGGATACHTYWTIHALYQLGRKEDARRILFPMLESFDHGAFQGSCGNGMSKDWKNWKGDCWGYEGFLVDGYLALLAVLDDSPLTK